MAESETGWIVRYGDESLAESVAEGLFETRGQAEVGHSYACQAPVRFVRVRITVEPEEVDRG